MCLVFTLECNVDGPHRLVVRLDGPAVWFVVAKEVTAILVTQIQSGEVLTIVVIPIFSFLIELVGLGGMVQKHAQSNALNETIKIHDHHINEELH